MSFISPKTFIFQNFFTKKFLDNENKRKTLVEKKEIKNTNDLIQKRNFLTALDKYLSVKKVIYFRNLEEEKNIGKKLTINKSNFSLDKFVRNRKITRLKLRDGIITKTNNLRNLKINSIFQKVKKKLTPTNNKKFNFEFNYSNYKNKKIKIKREIKEEKKSVNSMIDLGTNKFEDMFGDNIYKNKNENKENKDIINKIKKSSSTFLFKNISKKNKSNIINIKSNFKNEKSLFKQILGCKNNSIILKNSDFFKNNNKEEGFNVLSRNKNKSEFEIVKSTSIGTDSKFNQINFFRKSKNKTINKKYSRMKNFSRNKHNNSISLLSPESQKNRIIQKYNRIKKITEKMRFNYLDSYIVPIDQVDSVVKSRENLMMDFLKLSYLNDDGSQKIFLKKESKKKRPDNFKQRLLKSAEIFVDNGEFDI